MTFTDEVRYAKGFESFVDDYDAKKAWLDRLSTCSLCHGTALRLEPVIGTLGEVYSDPNTGRLMRQTSLVIGRTLYTGWVEATTSDLAPRSRQVLCDHR